MLGVSVSKQKADAIQCTGEEAPIEHRLAAWLEVMLQPMLADHVEDAGSLAVTACAYAQLTPAPPSVDAPDANDSVQSFVDGDKLYCTFPDGTTYFVRKKLSWPFNLRFSGQVAGAPVSFKYVKAPHDVGNIKANQRCCEVTLDDKTIYSPAVTVFFQASWPGTRPDVEVDGGPLEEVEEELIASRFVHMENSDSTYTRGKKKELKVMANFRVIKVASVLNFDESLGIRHKLLIRRASVERTCLIDLTKDKAAEIQAQFQRADPLALSKFRSDELTELLMQYEMPEVKKAISFFGRQGDGEEWILGNCSFKRGAFIQSDKVISPEYFASFNNRLKPDMYPTLADVPYNHVRYIMNATVIAKIVPAILGSNAEPCKTTLAAWAMNLHGSKVVKGGSGACGRPTIVLYSPEPNTGKSFSAKLVNAFQGFAHVPLIAGHQSTLPGIMERLAQQRDMPLCVDEIFYNVHGNKQNSTTIKNYVHSIFDGTERVTFTHNQMPQSTLLGTVRSPARRSRRPHR